MCNIVCSARKWTLKLFLKALFNHCFPANFKTLQHEKYDGFSQHACLVRDYCCNLEELASSVGRISCRQLAVCFWNGADHYLCIKWAEAGYNPEDSYIDKLEQAAERFEQAVNITKAEDRHTYRTSHADGHMLSRSSGGLQRATFGPANDKPANKPITSGQHFECSECSERPANHSWTYEGRGDCVDS